MRIALFCAAALAAAPFATSAQDAGRNLAASCAMCHGTTGHSVGGNEPLAGMPKDELLRLVKELESQMKAAARGLEFEKAAGLRDQVVEVRRQLVGSDEEELSAFAAVAGRGGPLRYGRSQAGGRDRRRRR